MLLDKETERLWVNGKEARKLLGGIAASTLDLKRKRGEITAKKLNPTAKNSTWLYLYADIAEKTN